jgi:hypothetical protein
MPHTTFRPLLRKVPGRKAADLRRRGGVNHVRVVPDVWSSPRCKRTSSRWRTCGLASSIWPLIAAFCAPGHHGYQRACDLISGKASMGAIRVTSVRVRRTG